MSLLRSRWWLLAVPVVLLGVGPAWSQLTFNEREVKSTPSKLDKADVWAFDFRFKDPRMIKVNVPGRGTRIFWYMWYQVVNRTGEQRNFIPAFELVTHDPPAVYLDEVLPTVEEAIKRREDPAGIQDIKNTALMTLKPIPVSKPAEEAFPRAVTGVAIWDASSDRPGKNERGDTDLSEVSRFSIFVRGLSNGHVLVDAPTPDLEPITRYKTLQLNFKRTGDRFSVDSRDVTFVPPAEWVYRAANRKNRVLPPAQAADKMK